VEILKIVIVCKTRPAGNIILSFKDSISDKRADKYKIKEDEIYNLRIYFKVRYDIVYGLKWVNIVSKHHIKIDKHEEMMGSFAPKRGIQWKDITLEQCPSGFFARGNYQGKAMVYPQISA